MGINKILDKSNKVGFDFLDLSNKSKPFKVVRILTFASIVALTAGFLSQRVYNYVTYEPPKKEEVALNPLDNKEYIDFDRETYPKIEEIGDYRLFTAVGDTYGEFEVEETIKLKELSEVLLKAQLKKEPTVLEIYDYADEIMGLYYNQNLNDHRINSWDMFNDYRSRLLEKFQVYRGEILVFPWLYSKETDL